MSETSRHAVIPFECAVRSQLRSNRRCAVHGREMFDLSNGAIESPRPNPESMASTLYLTISALYWVVIRVTVIRGSGWQGSIEAMFLKTVLDLFGFAWLIKPCLFHSGAFASAGRCV
jgi:hypothetical protein